VVGELAAATGCLAELALDEEARTAVIREGATGPLVQLCQRHTDSVVLANSCRWETL
jgi:hypothetical protein